MGLRQAAEKAGIVNPPTWSAANAPPAGTAANRWQKRCRRVRAALTPKNSLW